LCRAIIDRQVAAFDIAGFAKGFLEGDDEPRVFARRAAVENPDRRHCRLLRARRKRPRSRTAEERYECAAVHSITSSAGASRRDGIASPRAVAVLRLMTSSNLVACSIGRSAGLVPFKILPV